MIVSGAHSPFAALLADLKRVLETLRVDWYVFGCGRHFEMLGMFTVPHPDGGPSVPLTKEQLARRRVVAEEDSFDAFTGDVDDSRTTISSARAAGRPRDTPRSRTTDRNKLGSPTGWRAALSRYWLRGADLNLRPSEPSASHAKSQREP